MTPYERAMYAGPDVPGALSAPLGLIVDVTV
jgi:hypothetical protein